MSPAITALLLLSVLSATIVKSQQTPKHYCANYDDGNCVECYKGIDCPTAPKGGNLQTKFYDSAAECRLHCKKVEYKWTCVAAGQCQHCPSDNCPPGKTRYDEEEEAQCTTACRQEHERQTGQRLPARGEARVEPEPAGVSDTANRLWSGLATMSFLLFAIRL